MTFVPYDRPIRAAIIGLGRIYDLNIRAYRDNPDVGVVALVDPDPQRRAQRQAEWPQAQTFASAADLAASGLTVDAAEVLLPIPLHVEGVCEMLGYGWHLNLQKPMCSELGEAKQMLERGQTNDRVLRVMENYLFYQPLQKLKATVESGDLGAVSGYHMKMVGSGSGGWEVPLSSFEWQFKQMRRGRGILVFDDGWHKLSTALWLFGPLREVRAWVGGTEVFTDIEIDAPTTIVWEHQNGIRGVWDITLAPEMYLRSGLLHQRRTLGSHGPSRLLTGEPVHRPGHSAAEPRDLHRRRDADISCAGRRLGEQLPGLGTPLAALAPHGRRSLVVECRRSRRRLAVRSGRVRQ